MAFSLALSRTLASQLYGVTPTDPTTFAAIVAILAVTALLAVVSPAWRATRVDPCVALRGE
jgi:ABC-type lipoprotein release transport system permease subunit